MSTLCNPLTWTTQLLEIQSVTENETRSTEWISIQFFLIWVNLLENGTSPWQLSLVLLFFFFLYYRTRSLVNVVYWLEASSSCSKLFFFFYSLFLTLCGSRGAGGHRLLASIPFLLLWNCFTLCNICWSVKSICFFVVNMGVVYMYMYM